MEKIMRNVTVDDSFLEPALRLLGDYCRNRRDTLELSTPFRKFGDVFLSGQTIMSGELF